MTRIHHLYLIGLLFACAMAMPTTEETVTMRKLQGADGKEVILWIVAIAIVIFIFVVALAGLNQCADKGSCCP